MAAVSATLRAVALLGLLAAACADGGRREAAQAPSHCDSLLRLSRCVHDGITALQREPVKGELAVFVTEARMAGIAACELDDDGASVAWERREESVSHYDDGMFELHIVYRFRAHGCPEASMEVDLVAGTPSAAHGQ